MPLAITQNVDTQVYAAEKILWLHIQTLSYSSLTKTDMWTIVTKSFTNETGICVSWIYETNWRCTKTGKSDKVNKSRTVARVSRPYSWCTQSSSTMFRTCCCLRPKCKRSYLLIYITSGSYVNTLNVRYLLEILALQIAAKQLQLATWLLLTAYRNLPTPYPTVPSPTLYDVPFSHNTKRYRQTTDWPTDRTSYHKRDRTTQYGRLQRWHIQT